MKKRLIKYRAIKLKKFPTVIEFFDKKGKSIKLKATAVKEIKPLNEFT